jgi:hypothetical protein
MMHDHRHCRAWPSLALLKRTSEVQLSRFLPARFRLFRPGWRAGVSGFSGESDNRTVVQVRCLGQCSEPTEARSGHEHARIVRDQPWRSRGRQEGERSETEQQLMVVASATAAARARPFHFLGLFVGRLDMPDVYRVVRESGNRSGRNRCLPRPLAKLSLV